MSRISHATSERPSLFVSSIVLVLSLLLVGTAAWFSQQAAHDEFDRRVNSDATAFAQSLEQGIAEIEATMAGVSGLFVAADEVSLTEYRRYVDHIELPDGLLGIAFSPIVPADELSTFEEGMRRLIPGYAVWDWSPDGPVKPAPAETYFPVQYFEPIAVQQSSYGLNATSPPGRAQLIGDVILSGRDSASPMLPLAISGEIGVLIFRPVVRANSEVIGILTVPVEQDALVNASVSTALRQRLDWQIIDATDSATQEVIQPEGFAWRGTVASRHIAMTDRVWRINITAASGISPGFSARFYTIIIVGMLMAALLTTGTHLFVRRRQTQRRLEEVEGILEVKESFIASVSHELRTPLTGVLGFAELLRDWSGTMSETERDELVGTIASEAGELSNIVEDLIVMARADHGTLSVVAVPVNLTAQCAQVLEMVAHGDRIAIDVNVSLAKASADPARVRQIVRNLVTNADSYGGDNVRIAIDVVAESVRVAVCDDGAGIPAGFEEMVFHPYQRAHENSGKAASIGLGLSISRKLARAMHGDLTYERVGHESQFVLSLPLLREEQIVAA